MTEVGQWSWSTADGTMLGGQRHDVRAALLHCNAGNGGRHADPEVYNRVRLQLHGGAPHNNFALV